LVVTYRFPLASVAAISPTSFGTTFSTGPAAITATTTWTVSTTTTLFGTTTASTDSYIGRQIALSENFAPTNPDFNPNFSVNGLGFFESVINVST
jgi:hypothetical protein